MKFSLRYLALFLYYSFLRWLPHSTVPVIGPIIERVKEFCCKLIFKSCGSNVNIGRNARFGRGENIVIGNNSGIGINAKVPSDLIIGMDVMMGQNVIIFGSNHAFDRVDIPMLRQGYRKYPPVVIEDDVWIGSNVIILPGRRIKKGSVIAAGTVLTKDFPEYSIVGGNPSRLIKSRI